MLCRVEGQDQHTNTALCTTNVDNAGTLRRSVTDYCPLTK